MLSTLQRAQTFTDQQIKLRNIFEMPTTTNLIDVFSVVPKHHFGDLWRFVILVQTIMPTTVGCEQTLSYFKRTNHFNMSDKTAQLFLFARLNLYEKSTNFSSNKGEKRAE